MTREMDVPVFEISRVFAAPQARVWQAWTDPVQFGQWFGPAGCSGEVLAFDFTPGGTTHYRITMGDQGTLYGKFVYREIIEPSRLTWVHSFADAAGAVARSPFSADWPMELLAEVAFTAVGEKTQVVLTWTPMNATPAELACFRDGFASMTQGWGGTFDRLEQFLG